MTRETELRARVICNHLLSISTFVLFLIMLVACQDRIDEVSDLPAIPPTVKVKFSTKLQEAIAKNESNSKLKLLLDDTSYDENLVVINGHSAIWEIAELPTNSAYDISVLVEFELDSNPNQILIAAQAKSIHDFGSRRVKEFRSTDFNIDFDEDGDTMSNLDEIILGGNPYSPAPTIVSSTQVAVLENALNVLSIEAITPRIGDTIKFNITKDTDNLFQIDESTGVLSFKNLAVFNSDPSATNEHKIEIQADDGSYTSTQIITVTITNTFDLKIDIGFKQLNFHWSILPGAEYYKIVKSLDNGQTFTQLPGSATITSANYNHPLSVHLIDQLNTKYKLQAYQSINGSEVLKSESVATHILGNLNQAVGYLKANNTEASTFYFGDSVSLSSDGGTLAVGATRTQLLDNTGAPILMAGAIYLLSKKPNGSWGAPEILTAPNPGEFESFGINVSLSGDGKTLAVASPGKNVLNSSGQIITGSGAVYVFSKDSEGSWGKSVMLQLNDPKMDQFGSGVSLSADGETLAVAAPGTDFLDAANAGAVFIFYKISNGVWSNPIMLHATNPIANEIGSSVSINANGQTLAVGVPKKLVNDSTGTLVNAGSVYIFNKKANDSWSEPISLQSKNPTRNDRFGWSVSLSANGETLAVGASHKNIMTNAGLVIEAGAVYIFSADANNVWVEHTMVVATNPELQENFGHSVSLSADANVLAVGAWLKDIVVNTSEIASNAGAVYVLSKNANSIWSEPNIFQATNPDSSDYFGYSVDINSDGSTLIVGAKWEAGSGSGLNDTTPGIQNDNSKSRSGAVYLF